jgi:hypothetical protein
VLPLEQRLELARILYALNVIFAKGLTFIPIDDSHAHNMNIQCPERKST